VKKKIQNSAATTQNMGLLAEMTILRDYQS